ncbi:MAG TPA: energy transducer TonB [Burkholderiales bacterium]|nr:energy transducer TonB [Burkholderiales bacterium]
MARLERRFGGRDRPTGAFEMTERMRTALIASFLLHLAVIFGVGFTLPAKPKPEIPNQSLEVVLVNAKSTTKPVVADAQAQVNLDGGGNTDEKRRASTPLPAVPEQKTDADVKLALRRVEQLEREARQVMTQQQAKAPIETAEPVKPAPTAEAEVKPQPSAADIMQRSLELARLEAKISRDWQAYQERPRRRFIGSRTQETRFARYVEDWRQKIERVGDLNYPQGARDQRLHGRLLVTVAIRSDGSVEEVSINRSSGHKVLDDGARRIVELSAPFAPFPPDIAKDVDILHITRTWTFTTGDRFVSE